MLQMPQMRMTLTAELVWIKQCLQNTVWYNRVCYSCSQDILRLEEHQISANFQVVIQMAMYYEAHQPELLPLSHDQMIFLPISVKGDKMGQKWKVFFWCWILHSDDAVADSPIRRKLLGHVYFTVKFGTQNLPPNNMHCLEIGCKYYIGPMRTLKKTIISLF